MQRCSGLAQLDRQSRLLLHPKSVLQFNFLLGRESDVNIRISIEIVLAINLKPKSKRVMF